MSTYREIGGKKIKKVSSDPSSGTDGEMWYNSTTGTLRGLAISSAWVSASPINTARGYLAGITSTAGQTAGLIFGGNIANPGLTGATATEEYNGSGWSIGGNLSTGRVGGAGLGTQTAAVFAGGRTPPAGTPPNDKDATITEEYDGSSWTSGGALSTGRRYLSAAGTLTSGLAFAGTTGGAPGAGTAQSTTEEYDGSSWTSGGALNVARQSGAGTGESQSAAIMFGGSNTPSNAKTETYDGSSWTAQPDMNSGTNAQAGFGTSTSAISAGGETYRTNVEDWNGSSWAVNPATIAVGNQALVGGGSSTAGLVMGGWRPAPLGNTTQEYNSSTNLVTAAAWASGGNLGTARAYVTGAGLQTAAIVVAGYNGAVVSNVEEYDGTSWSEENNLGTSRYNVATLGVQTAAFACGGRTPPPDTGSTTVESYNGSSWTSAPSLNSARTYLMGVGTTTAGLVAMGANPRSTASNLAEEYNGSSWSAVNTNGTTRRNVGAGGIQTSALYFGGGPTPTATEEYDGTNWTAGGNLGTGRYFTSGSSNAPGNSAVFAIGGNTGSSTGATEGYDGTSWSTRPSLATARHALAGAGTASAALAAGGNAPPWSNATEEFTPESTAANIKDFTTS